MNDLIARNRLLKEIRETYEYEFPTASGDFDRFVTKILPNIICNQPTVDAVPLVHGHWTKYEVDVAEHPWHCSQCGWTPPKYVCHIDEMEYCPHCGARMDEQDGDSDYQWDDNHGELTGSAVMGFGRMANRNDPD